MKSADHIALTAYLLKHCPPPPPLNTPLFRKLFRLGGILPDYLPHTYLRGIRESGKMLGHNTAHSDAYVRKTIIRLQKNGIHTPADFYTFGTLIHYLSDSFTYPHTPKFHGTVRQHNRYERDLHEIFPDCLARAGKEPFPSMLQTDPTVFLTHAQTAYAQSPVSLRVDGEWIIYVCSTIYRILITQ